MTPKPDDFLMKVWKQQMCMGLRLVETITEESRKLREFQLAAALEAHRSAEAAHQLFEKAADAQELWRIQNEWLSASLEKSVAYWRRLYEAGAQTQLGVTRCLCEPVDMTASQAPTVPNIALFGMMDEAYQRWVDTTRRFYAAPAAAEPRKAA